MPVSADFQVFVLEQLAQLGGVRARRMFGGVGLYRDDVFFGLISNDVLYFKVDDSNRSDYASLGMKPFRPFPDQPRYVMWYFEVPASALDEPEELAVWAHKSLAVAMSASTRRPVKDQTTAKKSRIRSMPKAKSRKRHGR